MREKYKAFLVYSGHL
jgi:hypothetical protein